MEREERLRESAETWSSVQPGAICVRRFKPCDCGACKSDTGEKEGISVSKRKNSGYANESLGDIRVIEYFLPGPVDLVFKEENVKLTLDLYAARHQ
jgi:hypothetical protein